MIPPASNVFVGVEVIATVIPYVTFRLHQRLIVTQGRATFTENDIVDL